MPLDQLGTWRSALFCSTNLFHLRRQPWVCREQNAAMRMRFQLCFPVLHKRLAGELTHAFKPQLCQLRVRHQAQPMVELFLPRLDERHRHHHHHFCLLLSFTNPSLCVAKQKHDQLQRFAQSHGMRKNASHLLHRQAVPQIADAFDLVSLQDTQQLLRTVLHPASRIQLRVSRVSGQRYGLVCTVANVSIAAVAAVGSRRRLLADNVCGRRCRPPRRRRRAAAAAGTWRHRRWCGASRHRCAQFRWRQRRRFRVVQRHKALAAGAGVAGIVGAGKRRCVCASFGTIRRRLLVGCRTVTRKVFLEIEIELRSAHFTSNKNN
eukprot:Rhum_TRINITY_DN6754_c0_g1::Rhum_TRINITY_DN6754_c0_g1_i1::g.20902::m.20902